ncbi:TonB-dependent receptor [Adhaeribacter soli]|uniref:TonB-dependent receptor plug domain-containing protein n=1 Tax=Adhaeribacter soli TaxID=2607655 RepID=A0A5N1IHY1_9BACT|nr:TonB-dependent receptor [Adhaeribacter soli]KAA9325242.1 TonB-dependent receptor plug domain-containing protein [Adhaeribacter soli]
MLKNYFKICFFFMLFLSGAPKAWAQTAEVRGFLYDEKNGDPLIYSTVLLYSNGKMVQGAQTDVNGYFSITRIQPGSYILMPRSIGYDTLEVPIVLKPNEIKTQKFYLKQTDLNLKEIEVKAGRTVNTTTVNVAVEKITPRQITALPSIGGEPDVAQYLQTIPGVVSTGDQGGQLYIRGGTPVQTLFLLDGMIIYNPFHSIGLFSVFDTDIIRNVEVYTGGFNAEYGGRTSAVMDVTTRDGNRKKFGGVVSVNPFTSKLVLEGPLSKPKDGVSNSSFLLSGRTSYLDKTSKTLYKYANEDGLPYSFTDVYGKASFNSTGGNKLNLFGFNFNDRVNLASNSQVKWDSYGFGTDFMLLPSSSSLLMRGLLAYSNYDIGITEPIAQPRTSKINGFNLGLDFTYFINQNELKYGISVIGNKTNFIGYTPSGVEQKEEQNNTEMAGFFKYRIVKSLFVLEPSIRLHYYASLATFSPEPRLGFKYNISEKLRFKFAGGFFTQNFLATRSDQDVVNLFAGFISSPESLVDADGKRVENPLQKARHLMAGFEYDVNDKVSVNVEPYIKDFNQLVNINRNRLFGNEAPYIVESGIAKGIDLALKYASENVLFQAGYSLAEVDRKFGKQEYATNFDRRHNANLLGTYTFGKEKSFEISGRWNLGSGFPFTPTQGFFERNLTGSIDSDLTSENGELGILYGDMNSKRLPYYHRLDLSAKKTFKLKNATVLEINADVVNVYNRKNIFYFDRISSQRVDQLPVLPSLGLRLKF